MDLNSAIHTARCGGYVRDDGTMVDGWKVCFVPKEGKENAKLPPADRLGLLYYINPLGERAHVVRITDAMRASYQWKTVP